MSDLNPQDSDTIWLTAVEVGKLIDKTGRAVLNCVYLGKEGPHQLVPQSTKLGGRRRWDKKVVDLWIDAGKKRSSRDATVRRAKSAGKS